MYHVSCGEGIMWELPLAIGTNRIGRVRGTKR